MGWRRFERFGDTGRNGVMQAGLATTLGMDVVAMWRSQLRVVYGGVRNSTVGTVITWSKVQITSTKKKKETYLIGVSDERVGRAGSSTDVCGSLCGVHAGK